MRTGIAAARNARVATTVEFGVDPVGLRMFQGLSAVIHRGINGTDGTSYRPHEDDPNGNAYNGSLGGRILQAMTGAAALGTARSVNERTAELSDERSRWGTNPLDNAAFRILAERMERRK